MSKNKNERSPNSDKENKTPKKPRNDDSASQKLDTEKIKEENNTTSSGPANINDVQNNRRIYKKTTPDKPGGRSIYHSKCCSDERNTRLINVPKNKTSRGNTSTDLILSPPEKSEKRRALKRKLDDNNRVVRCNDINKAQNCEIKEINIDTNKSSTPSTENVLKTDFVSLTITDDKNPTEAANKENEQTNRILISEYLEENTDNLIFREPTQEKSELLPLLNHYHPLINIIPKPKHSEENADTRQEPVEDNARRSGLVQHVDADIVPAVHLGHPGANQNDFVAIPLNDIQVQPAENIGNELNESSSPNLNSNTSILLNYLRTFVNCDKSAKELYITVSVIVIFGTLTFLIYYLMKTKKYNQ